MTKNLNAYGSFSQGFSLINELRNQQIQQQKFQYAQEQQRAKEQLAVEAFNNPEVLTRLYAVDPQAANGVLNAKEHYNNIAYQSIESLKNAKDKQKAWSSIKSNLQRSGINVSDLGDDYSPELANQLQGIQQTLMSPEDMLKMKKQISDIELQQAHANYFSRYASGKGGEDPAAIKIANKLDEYRRTGQTQKFNDLIATSKIYEKGLGQSEEGNVEELPGYIAAAQNIKGSQKLSEKMGEKQAEALNDLYEKANSAQDSQYIIDQARSLLDKGVITGFGADYKLGFGKALQAAGVNLAEDAVANTEAFAANAAQSVAENIKAFGSGTGLSDADREFTAKMVGGKITLNEKSIRKILEIREKQNRFVINKYSDRRENLAPNLREYLPDIQKEQVKKESKGQIKFLGFE